MNAVPHNVIERLNSPRLSLDSQSTGKSCLKLTAFPFKTELATKAPLTGKSLSVLSGEAGASSADWLEELRTVLGLDAERARAMGTLLLERGFVRDAPVTQPTRHLDAEYVGWRLVAQYRAGVEHAVRSSELLKRLTTGAPAPNLARGLLLETYMVVRSAKWTGQPVLQHGMTLKQRELLDEFYNTEADHGSMLAEGLAQAYDMSMVELASLDPTPATHAYCLGYYAHGQLSVAEFAAALILPEVPQFPKRLEAQGLDLLDLLEERHGVSSQALSGFREHECDDHDADHGALPVQILAECEGFDAATIRRLRMVVATSIHLYAGHLDSIVPQYGIDHREPSTS